MAHNNKPNTVYLKRKTSEGVFLRKKLKVGPSKRTTIKYHPIGEIYTKEEKKEYIKYFISEYKHRLYLRKELEKNTIDLDNYFKKH